MFIEGFYNIWYLTWVFFYSAKSYEISEIFGWENRGTESLNSMQVLIISEWVVQKATVSDSQIVQLLDLTPSHLNLIWMDIGHLSIKSFWSMECQIPCEPCKDFQNKIPVILSAMRPRLLNSTYGSREWAAPSESYSRLRVMWRWWCLDSFLISVFSSVRVCGVL